MCRPFLTVLVFAAAAALRAQSTVPAVTQPFPTQSLVVGGLAASIDLRNYFSVPGVTGQVVQFDIVGNKFNVEMLASDAPQSVSNFLAYVADQSYTSTIIHRALGLNGASNRVVQGGGYNTDFNAITRKAPIPLEYKLANTRGTLAMARSSEQNSATSEWFFNVDDNTTVLGAGNGGGYAVFGRVIGTGMNVVDAVVALPTYPVGSLTNVPLRDIQSGQTTVTLANEIVVNSITAIPVYPAIGAGATVIGFTGGFSAGGSTLVTGVIYGSTLLLKPTASGNASITITATDSNGNATSSTLPFTVAAAPVFSTQPASQTIAASETAAFIASATAGSTPTYQWQVNGNDLIGATSASLTVNNVQPANTGLYTAVATSGTSGTSAAAILGVSTTSKVIGLGHVIATDIVHPNKNVFDQVLLDGVAEAITAEGSKVTRTSFIDDNDDIVQVEFGGAGTLSLVMENYSGPAAPLKYTQPSVSYMKGHAGIVITGADETTNVSVFTVGRATAVDITGAFNTLLPISATNNPANNGAAIFQGQSATVYNGVADISFIAIASANGKFGGIRTSNAKYSASKGLTGVYAPGVTFSGPVFVGNITASGTASPVLVIGSSPDTRITGGNLLQTNGQPVKVLGLTQLKFTAGLDSQGNSVPEYYNQSVLLQNDVNVTNQIVSY